VIASSASSWSDLGIVTLIPKEPNSSDATKKFSIF